MYVVLCTYVYGIISKSKKSTLLVLCFLLSDELSASKRGWNNFAAGYGKRGWNNFAAGYGKRSYEVGIRGVQTRGGQLIPLPTYYTYIQMGIRKFGFLAGRGIK